MVKRHTGDQFAIAVFVIKPFKEVAQHVRTFDIGVDLRVHRLDRVKQPEGIALIFGKVHTLGDIGGLGLKRKAERQCGGCKCGA